MNKKNSEDYQTYLFSIKKNLHKKMKINAAKEEITLREYINKILQIGLNNIEDDNNNKG